MIKVIAKYSIAYTSTIIGFYIVEYSEEYSK